MVQFNKVFGYVRFSTKEQSDGNSLERQRGDIRQYIEREGFGHLPFEELFDEGKSAYHGDQFATGLLGQFERECHQGIHRGSLFVVENLDRLTREGFDRGRDFTRALTNNGVEIRSLTGERFEVGTTPDIATLMRSVIAFELAREESAKKSARTKDNWTRVRARAREAGTATRTNAAPWLRVKPDRTVEVIPERAALVLRMFKLADDGMGEGAIARLYEKEGIATWTDRKSRNAKVWQRTMIRKVLDSRKTIGEFQPMKKVGGKLVEDGEPWVGHYPAVVPTDLFERVNNNRQARLEVKGGRKSATVVNLFSSMVRCHCCGGFYRYAKGRAAGEHVTKSGKRYVYKRQNGSLYCDTARVSQGQKCQNVGYWAYLTFEDALTKAVLHLAMDDSNFANRGEAARVGELLAQRRRELEIAQTKAARLWEAFAESGSDNAMKLAQKVDEETTALTATIEGLKRQLADASGRVSNAAHLARVEDIRRDLYCEDLEKRRYLRTKVATSMRTLIESITVTNERAIIRLKGAVGSLYLDRKGNVSGLDTFKDYRPFDKSLEDYARRYAAAKEAGTLPYEARKAQA